MRTSAFGDGRNEASKVDQVIGHGCDTQTASPPDLRAGETDREVMWTGGAKNSTGSCKTAFSTRIRAKTASAGRGERTEQLRLSGQDAGEEKEPLEQLLLVLEGDGQ